MIKEAKDIKILIVNENDIFRKAFYSGIEKEGFHVNDLFKNGISAYKKDFIKKIKNYWKIKICKTNSFYHLDSKKDRERKILNMIVEDKEFYDYILIFRADRFSRNHLVLLREKSHCMITYQYDGMKVCGDLIKNLDLFDSIYTFDHNDLANFEEFRFKPLTNCWFSEESKGEVVKIENDIFYVGVGVPHRITTIEKVQSYCEQHNISLNAFLTIQPYFKSSFNNGITLSTTVMSYEENMNTVRKSKALLDFKLDYHEGLSFRFFEALHYGKKIITNNKTAIDYDFFHPNNIFITDFDNLTGLEEFLNRPYCEIDAKIKKKYGLSNWIRYVINLDPHIKIELPTSR